VGEQESGPTITPIVPEVERAGREIWRPNRNRHEAEPGPEIGEEQGLALIITSLAGVSFESATLDYWPHTRSGMRVPVKGERPV
jgi:hypothetical protein